MVMRKILSKLKANPVVSEAYQQLKESIVQYDIAEVTPVLPRADQESEELRLNLIVPSVDKKHVFGGIATAIHFFEDLVCRFDHCKVRIISLDAPVCPENLAISGKYQIVKSDQDSKEDFQLVEYCDRYQKSIPVWRKDVFISTGWWTAYTIRSVLLWQAEHYHQKLNPLIYLIQDYEPGFYPWSSRYLMADSTYQMDIPVFAVFNSMQLRDFFSKEGYVFAKNWCFEPVLNQKLKQFLPSQNQKVSKKRQIIVYGRPGTARNAFEVIVAALKLWASRQQDAEAWKVYSAGEVHPNIDLGNGLKLHSVGKLSLEDYARCMMETYAGISLMVSPHPSYPPLEMSTFGIRTITNHYANKDISSFNNNIISLRSAAPENIAEQLCRLCDEYTGEGMVYAESEYVRREKVFADITTQIGKEIREWF